MIQTTKTLSASEVKNNFGAIANQVKNGAVVDVVVENRGEPIVAIVSMDDREALREYRERERRKEALERLRRLRTRIQTRIKGKITDKEADEIANRFSRELVEDLEKTGKIKFEKNAS